MGRRAGRVPAACGAAATPPQGYDQVEAVSLSLRCSSPATRPGSGCFAAQVAVKIVPMQVAPGESVDLEHEPLLRWAGP